MDKTETWIKMCDKVPEDFPGKYSMEWGDYYAVGNEVRIHFGSAFCLLQNGRITKLYRQDQLQEMLPEFLNRETTYMNELTRAIIDDFYKLEKVKTWEQLWLAFVMKERCNMVWDGEAWNDSH